MAKSSKSEDAHMLPKEIRQLDDTFRLVEKALKLKKGFDRFYKNYGFRLETQEFLDAVEKLRRKD